MYQKIVDFITEVADFLCGYPLFFLIIGGGLFLMFRSRFISFRGLKASITELRTKNTSGSGQISSFEALSSVIAATVGMGSITGVAIALCVGGPGAIFWMWVSAVVGMCTKFHEGALTTMFKGRDSKGVACGGTMYIVENGLGRKWKPLGVMFATAGLFGTLCILNTNQLGEAIIDVFATPEGIASSSMLTGISSVFGFDNLMSLKMIYGIIVAVIVAIVVLGGIKRIASVASRLVPFMIGLYFVMVLYIVITNIGEVPSVLAGIFRDAFTLEAGAGGAAGIIIVALTGARRAALVNEAGVGTATIMHGATRSDNPVREGLVAMLGPAIDSGLVCTLTAIAILLCGNYHVEEVKGLTIALGAFDAAIPYGRYFLLVVITCFAVSSMFSYSFYGTHCAKYLFGENRARWYTYFYIATLVVFAMIPLQAAVGLCDLAYFLMAVPTMTAVLALSGKVRRATDDYFRRKKSQDLVD
ncbi:MAG: alanine:cation symporter family protein [Muribaculaceae bacterium]|nr:alanine:cation symporter family protein [Muribaculaceae bacterium]MBR5744080.1 alanine:cation symporter family protein [Muribaculaceae bacterium]